MRNRRQRAKRQRMLRWGSIGLLSLIIVLLVSSLIINRRPLDVIRGILGDVSGYSDDPMSMNKQALRSYVVRQEEIIDSLNTELSNCNSKRVRAGIVDVNTLTLNMRTKPSLASDVILRIPNGTEVTVNYFDTEKYYLDGIQGQWCNIIHAGQVGWVWGPYIKLIE